MWLRNELGKISLQVEGARAPVSDSWRRANACFHCGWHNLFVTVDEKERKHGNDPEKDLDNQRFLEYMKRFVLHIVKAHLIALGGLTYAKQG